MSLPRRVGLVLLEDGMGQAATREVRRVVEDLKAGRPFEHRLMAYNNLPTTSFADIRRVLRMARDRVAAQLARAP